MAEEVARGRSLEEIREKYSLAWGCDQEALKLEVLEKPGFLSRQWKVRLSWNPEESGEAAAALAALADAIDFPEPPIQSGQVCTTVWDEENKRYTLELAEIIRFVVPHPEAGSLHRNGQPQHLSFQVSPGDTLEFYPTIYQGQLTWTMEIREHGLLAVAKVTHEIPGRYTLPATIPAEGALRLENVIGWLDLESQGQEWGEDHFKENLKELGITFGIKPMAWQDIRDVEGEKEVVIAKGIKPIPPVQPKVENFVGGTPEDLEVKEDSHEDRIDFFASKVQQTTEGSVLARKIPGVSGTPGKDIKGQEIPAPPYKEINFKLKKNVHLSEDGLEVIASISGLPVRIDETGYQVENVYILNQDVDLSSGSIEFPGNVYVAGNVQDGLHIYSGGKVEIRGSVSKAEVRAEKGLDVSQSVIAGKLLVGESFVVRSELLKRIHNIHTNLMACLIQTNELMTSAGAAHLKPGQGLKLILERKFIELPKQIQETEKFMSSKKDELISQDLMLSIRTAYHFLAGHGPLEPQAIPLLGRISSALEQFMANISVEIPEKLSCKVNYIQGAVVNCGGSFECRNAAYNSNIEAAGDVLISGACRGGKITAGGNVEIKELGGSGISATTVQFPGTKRLKVSYCHPNVIIIVDKEFVRIEEAYRSLEVYREDGRVQIERLKG
jgi:hypothetical protein